MTQTTGSLSRNGWQQEEMDQLFRAISEGTAQGVPLRSVFEQMGQRLNRKPNSIRNFYYARIRDNPELAPGKSTFRTFDEEELHQLLRDVLIARGQGESVRSCVTRRAGGDRSAMLRYQNKYRAILKNRPELLMEVAEELRSEGLPCPDNVIACRRYGQPPQEESRLPLPQGYENDPGVTAVLEGLTAILRRLEASQAALKERSEADDAARTVPYEKWAQARQEADRLRVEVDLLKMALEDAGGIPSFEVQEN